jgi:hypothetical protein
MTPLLRRPFHSIRLISKCFAGLTTYSRPINTRCAGVQAIDARYQDRVASIMSRAGSHTVIEGN